MEETSLQQCQSTMVIQGKKFAKNGQSLEMRKKRPNFFALLLNYPLETFPLTMGQK